MSDILRTDVVSRATYETDTLTFSASATKQTSYFDWPVWAREAAIVIRNGGGQAVDVVIKIYDGNNFLGFSVPGVLYSNVDDVTAGAVKLFAKNAGGTGASKITQIAALDGNYYGFQLTVDITPAASMSGDVKMYVIWSS